MELGLQVASSDVFVRGILSGCWEELGRGQLHGEPGLLGHLLQGQPLVTVQLQARGDQLPAGWNNKHSVIDIKWDNYCWIIDESILENVNNIPYVAIKSPSTLGPSDIRILTLKNNYYDCDYQLCCHKNMKLMKFNCQNQAKLSIVIWQHLHLTECSLWEQ